MWTIVGGIRAGPPPAALTDLSRWTDGHEAGHGPVSFSGEMRRDRHLSPAEPGDLLPELNTLVPGGIYLWDRPDPWHFRDKIEQVTAAAYGARSRRMAQVLIFVASGCPSSGGSFGYYERAIGIFGELDGELSGDLAWTYAMLGHRRGGEAGKSGRANPAVPTRPRPRKRGQTARAASGVHSDWPGRRRGRAVQGQAGAHGSTPDDSLPAGARAMRAMNGNPGMMPVPGNRSPGMRSGAGLCQAAGAVMVS